MLKALISLCASTFKGNLIVGARAFHGNPYDGHTLSARVEQAGILMQDCGHKPTTAFVDQIVSDPRALCAALYAAQLVVL
jgi:hypothetical protein